MRKGVWLLGASLSALALACMAITVAVLDAAAAGWAVLAMVSVYSLERGLCSVSAKDVLGKTVSKTRRGALMGYSAAAAGVVTLLIGGYVELCGTSEQDAGFFTAMLIAAAGTRLPANVAFAAPFAKSREPAKAVATPWSRRCAASLCLKRIVRFAAM